MTVDELKDLITTTINLLTLNKDVFRERTLESLELIPQNAEALADVFGAILDFNHGQRMVLENSFREFQKLLDFEEGLIEKTDRIIEVLTKLRSRPLVLKVITRLF